MNAASAIIRGFKALLPAGEGLAAEAGPEPETTCNCGPAAAAELRVLEATLCVTDVPHFSQNFVSATNDEPQCVQNRPAFADAAVELRRAPHLVQNASVPANCAPQVSQNLLIFKLQPGILRFGCENAGLRSSRSLLLPVPAVCCRLPVQAQGCSGSCLSTHGASPAHRP